ncbi:2-succinyl-5-enolpyruvyl-6-hydroxy-3-cyclohexene-1-carboxylic-acid synthase [Marinoscillum pacificum]|uniref:2-succinyl-5-enolpyruvyl-6-hydroxy-3- cyclohexene-1-carboxylic-acid synthase n=1 Tax=Marinoscillum pacificum TaxID=392723 RepID=UPI0021583240|nr:2-succinyl-5-enolpyruvyl-6-hydroxy-3-cyclohexene-1-carboxylic-acid synthase [Marinoscillum pacificum]
MFSDNKVVQQLLSLMKQNEIYDVVISPGSRHYSITKSLESLSEFNLYSVVDERSAAFFALGLIQKLKKPVAICCTSGTSAANYISATVEAYYQELPLLVITADRLPQLLGQKEEQMFKQDDVFKGFTKFHAQIPPVEDTISEWYCNRVLNESLLALYRFGKGPVHINLPIERHDLDTFSMKVLPLARKIKLHGISSDRFRDPISQASEELSKKKLMILWGQSEPMSHSLRNKLDLFCEKFNCVIISDKLSNCHHSSSIEFGFPIFKAMNSLEKDQLFPDIVVTMFGNSTFNNDVKGYLKRHLTKVEHWDISCKGDVCDPFGRLSRIFEMSEVDFFDQILAQNDFVNPDAGKYFKDWKNVENQLIEPEDSYGEIAAIGKLMKRIPSNSCLQIANSLPIRIAHLFGLDKSVVVYCNRGVNGIDGCMSTAVGYAAASDELVFLLIGDLTFFYDMNALWNRHLSSNLRVLLLNNEGGGVMHLPLKNEQAEDISKHVSAGHSTNARGWAESVGINYFPVTQEQELENGLDLLISNSEKPIIVEVFTKKERDVSDYRSFFRKLNRDTLQDKVVQKLKNSIKGSFL